MKLMIGGFRGDWSLNQLEIVRNIKNWNKEKELKIEQTCGKFNYLVARLT